MLSTMVWVLQVLLAHLAISGVAGIKQALSMKNNYIGLDQSLCIF
jgi:hypothetical protein